MFKYIALFACLTLVAAEAVPDSSEHEWSIESVLDAADELHEEMKALPEGRRLTDASAQWCYWYRYVSCYGWWWWRWCYWTWGYRCSRVNCAGYWSGWSGWHRGNCYGYGVRYNTWIVYRNAAYGGYGCPYYHGYRLGWGAWVYSNVCPVHCAGYWTGWGGWSRANCYGYGVRYNTWIIWRNAAYGGWGCPYYHGYRHGWGAWVFYYNCCTHCSGYWGGWSGWHRANCYGYAYRYNTWYISRNRNYCGNYCPYYHGYRMSWGAWVYYHNCCTHCSGYWQGWGGWIRGNCYGYGYRANRWRITRNRNYCGNYCPYNHGYVIHGYHGWVFYNSCCVHCVGYWGGWSGWSRVNCNGLGRRYSRWYISRNRRNCGNNCPYYNGYSRTWDAWVFYNRCPVHCAGYWAGWGGWNRGNCYGYAYRSSTWYITRNRNSYGNNCPYNHGTVRHGYHGWRLSNNCPTPYPTPHPTPYPTAYPTTAPTVHNCDSGAHYCWKSSIKSFVYSTAKHTSILKADGCRTAYSSVEDQIEYVKITGNTASTLSVLVGYKPLHSGSWTMASGVNVQCWHHAGGSWDSSPVLSKTDGGIGYRYGYGRGPSRTHSFTFTPRAATGVHYLRCGIIDRASRSCYFDRNNHCASRTAGSSTAHHFDNADVKFTAGAGAAATCIKNRGGHEYSCECPAGYATLRGHISHWYGSVGYKHNCQKTPAPTAYPTSNPTAYPTPNPTAYPTTEPTNYPTPYPTPYPTTAPTNYPTPYPTSYPTSVPTNYPTPYPTAYPTSLPTEYPTPYPTAYPTTHPTTYPTPYPTAYPTSEPTTYPTPYPTAYPTSAPTGLMQHNQCAHTFCEYIDGQTTVMGLLSKKEQWHCERTMEKKFVKEMKKVVTVAGCKCVCHESLGCSIRHHHTSGYKKTFEHCVSKIAAPTPSPKASKGITLAGYAEGSHYHKAVTVFNDGCHTEDVSEFHLDVYHNGATKRTYHIKLEGTLKPGEALNVCHSKSAGAGYSAAWKKACKIYSKDLLHNGNDVIQLMQGDRVVYSIGTKGSSATFAKDRTCIRTSAGTFPAAWNCKHSKNTVPTHKNMPVPKCDYSTPTFYPTPVPTPKRTATISKVGTKFEAGGTKYKSNRGAKKIWDGKSLAWYHNDGWESQHADHRWSAAKLEEPTHVTMFCVAPRATKGVEWGAQLNGYGLYGARDTPKLLSGHKRNVKLSEWTELAMITSVKGGDGRKHLGVDSKTGYTVQVHRKDIEGQKCVQIPALKTGVLYNYVMIYKKTASASNSIMGVEVYGHGPVHATESDWRTHKAAPPSVAPTKAPTAPLCKRASETDSVAIKDDVFFKGAYIQLGINRHAYCGTHAKVPVARGWVKTSHMNTGLCAIADPHKDGWNRRPDGKKDNFHGPFTVPGSPQEAWVIGYYQSGSRKISDFGRAGFRDPNGFKCTIKDQTNKAAGQLGATSVCKNSALEVTHVVGFAACDTAVNWDVTVKALRGGITNVVYLRNLDPDNDLEKKGGSRSRTFVTRNTILGQISTGSKYSLVAATSNVGTDSFFGLFSRDSRSRARYGGFNNDDPWTAEFNKVSSTYKTSATILCDCAIDMQFRLGNLASGKSTKFNMKWVFDKKENLSLL